MMTHDPVILLVDDEDGFREIIAKRLTRRGFRVFEADGGAKALTLLDRQPVEVVILDVRMPGMDGIECLRRIKAGHDMTEVILLTGHADIHVGIEGIKSGAFDYLSKPVELEHLIRKITQAHNKIRRLREEKQELAFKDRMLKQMVVAERLAALGTMATGVAHEINNPLAVIRDAAGWLGQILAKPDMAAFPRIDDFNKALNKITQAVDRAGKITHQLLHAVNSQTMGTVEPSLVPANPVKLVDEAVTLVEPEANHKKITLVRDCPPELPHLVTDPFQLLQVLINLLSNAIQATGENGRIVLAVKALPEHIVMTVTDNGSGISAEYLPRIFEPFFTTKEAGQGTGMGLYVSWGIIRNLGGTIDVESAVGVGTTFTITLPLGP
jgi:signal transduction histidine kinase